MQNPGFKMTSTPTLVPSAEENNSRIFKDLLRFFYYYILSVWNAPALIQPTGFNRFVFVSFVC